MTEKLTLALHYSGIFKGKIGRALYHAELLALAWLQATGKEWASLDPKPTLPLSCLVRAKHPLDGGRVAEGSLGYVFGETNVYSDGHGPVVQWIMGNEDGGVCNVYPGDVTIEHIHLENTGSLEPFPPEAVLSELRALLYYSWADINGNYDSLTRIEKALLTRESFEALRGWLLPEVGQHVTVVRRITEDAFGAGFDAEPGDHGTVERIEGLLPVVRFHKTGTERIVGYGAIKW